MGHRTCQFPMGPTDHEDDVLCGEDSTYSKYTSYCPTHAHVVVEVMRQQTPKNYCTAEEQLQFIRKFRASLGIQI